ncbi:hypothetical protein HAX54_025633 [Datura stramonium]|uniref:Uncharacterized protein n=1 Tax=Datura stramonium TaxID=4076 RepID=A0ABS8V1T4_DATST|nr:hypothetical protein [Datura stramonium]
MNTEQQKSWVTLTVFFGATALGYATWLICTVASILIAEVVLLLLRRRYHQYNRLDPTRAWRDSTLFYFGQLMSRLVPRDIRLIRQLVQALVPEEAGPAVNLRHLTLNQIMSNLTIVTATMFLHNVLAMVRQSTIIYLLGAPTVMPEAAMAHFQITADITS